MNIVKDLFRSSGFLFLEDQWARVISGQDEGAYMWLTINYLLKNLNPLSKVLTIDLGGASTQIAFRPNTIPAESEIDLNIPNFYDYDIYSISYLGYGNDQARYNIALMSKDA